MCLDKLMIIYSLEVKVFCGDSTLLPRGVKF